MILVAYRLGLIELDCASTLTANLRKGFTFLIGHDSEATVLIRLY